MDTRPNFLIKQSKTIRNVANNSLDIQDIRSAMARKEKGGN
jgi:hypothetical protein